MFEFEANPMVGQLSAEDLQALRQAVKIRQVKASEIIFNQGDEADGLYFVAAGRIVISATAGEGRSEILSRIQPGGFFGEMALFNNAPRSATAQADEDSMVYLLLREDLRALALRSPPLPLMLAVELLREMSERIRDSNRRYLQEILQTERIALLGRFAGSIFHDFKNPLNVIALSADLVSMPEASAEARRTARERIHKQVDRLITMINEVLEFARGNRVPTVKADINFAEFLGPLLEDLQAAVAEHRVTIGLENEPPSVMLLADPARLTTVFYNLVHNAIDAMAPSGGAISIRFSMTEKGVSTEVQDAGRGIPQEIAEHLFEPFVTHGKSHGTGLGLSICKRIVEDHGGTISARNQPGAGAAFTFTLPLLQTPNPS